MSQALKDAAVHCWIVWSVTGPRIPEALGHLDRMVNSFKIEHLPGTRIPRSVGTVKLKGTQQRLAVAATSENVRLHQALSLGKRKFEAPGCTDCFLDRVERHQFHRLIT